MEAVARVVKIEKSEKTSTQVTSTAENLLVGARRLDTTMVLMRNFYAEKATGKNGIRMYRLIAGYTSWPRFLSHFPSGASGRQTDRHH